MWRKKWIYGRPTISHQIWVLGVHLCIFFAVWIIGVILFIYCGKQRCYTILGIRKTRSVNPLAFQLVTVKFQQGASHLSTKAAWELLWPAFLWRPGTVWCGPGVMEWNTEGSVELGKKRELNTNHTGTCLQTSYLPLFLTPTVQIQALPLMLPHCV